MAARTDRIEARVEPERAERIRLASALLHQSVSSFVVEAAAHRAEEVILEHGFTEVDDRYFAQLMTALDEPGRPVGSLARAADAVAESPAFERR